MPRKECAVALLAAGKGTRLKLPIPKALAPLLGRKLIDFTLDLIAQFAASSQKELVTGVVVGHQKEQLEAHLKAQYPQRLNKKSIEICTQEEQKGTGHALQCCMNQLPHFWETEFVMICCADTPLITPEVYKLMFASMEADKELEAVVVSFETQNPTGYGRIVRGHLGLKIVEEKDADPTEQQIKEVNSGLYLIRTRYLKKYLNTLENNNKSGEFYITDLFKQDEKVKAIPYRDELYFLGVNDAWQLETCQQILLKRKINDLRACGVFLENSQSFYCDWNVEISSGTKIEPNVSIRGNTKIGRNSLIETGSIIKDSIIAGGVTVLGHSYLEKCEIHSGATIGPFARLRPGADIGEEAKVGNFVEVKNSVLAKGAKVSHLSYIGDAEIGQNSNIGCGFITCNYDGINKHKTIVGSNSFIGSDCQSVAPVKIGNNSFVAAGSTITKNVPDGAFAIARSKQTIKEGQANRFLKKKEQ